MFDSLNRRKVWWRPRVGGETTTHFRTDALVTMGFVQPPARPADDPLQDAHQQVNARTVRRTTTYDAEGSVITESLEETGVADAHATITTFSTLPPDGAPSGAPLPCDPSYVCRPSYVTLWAQDRPGLTDFRPRRATRFDYGSSCQPELGTGCSWPGPTTVFAGVGDQLPLLRQHPTGGAKSDGRATDGHGQGLLVMEPIATFAYDAVGNVVTTTGDPAPAHGDPVMNTSFDYDVAYGQFVHTMYRFRNGLGDSALFDTFIYDRATGTSVVHYEPNGAASSVELDTFGRPSQVYAPDPEGVFVTVPAATVSYHLGAPLSAIQTDHELGAGTQVSEVALVNGLGETVADFVGSGSYWVARSVERDRVGRTSAVRAPKVFSGSPLSLAALAPPGLFAPSARGAEITRDGFGRATRVDERTVSGLLVPVAGYDHHVPFEMTYRDAEQLRPSSPRYGDYTQEETDHRGYLLSITRQRGAVRHREQLTHLATGETTQLDRFDDGALVYSRSAKYDTLGRLTATIEPNVGEWRYVYARDGQLLGTSDARGCGVDYYYDGLGRVYGEDYSPCSLRQPTYTEPTPATREGFEVVYQYDDYEPGQSSSDATFNDWDLFAVGGLTSVRDRAGHTRFNHDARGRLRALSRHLAVDEAATGSLPAYALEWFKSRIDYDLGNRMTRRTTGVSSGAPYLLVNGESAETRWHDLFGRPTNVFTSYGTLIRGTTYAPDGLVESIGYGDGALTQSEFTYDDRRRLASAKTWRTAPALWSGPATPSYSLPPAWSATTVLHDIRLSSYDEVGNPGVIRDQSTVWNVVGQPAKQRVLTYDRDDRVTSVAFSYEGGSAPTTTDARWRHPFAAELTSGDRSPVPLRSTTHRATSQTFTYDGTGNLTSSGDNTSLNWDRSLGAITRGTATDGPNQLRAAQGITAAYDEAGNLVELKVDRQGTCTSGGVSRCKQWFSYDWDETGKLLRARRWDYTTSFPLVAPGASASERGVPSDPPTRDLRYAYSLGERVIAWKYDEVGAMRATADVLPTLRLADAELNGAGDDYIARDDEQRPRLAGMAEVRWLPGLPSPTGSGVHMFQTLTDELGSSTVVLEHATGELAERATYQPYGATEQDTRPTRWGAHRAPLRFTGKEDDLEVGLTYFGARYYAPNLGQWASADPLTIHAMGADLNPYAYVAGRVSTHVDPFGLDSCGADGAYRVKCPNGDTVRRTGENSYEIETSKPVAEAGTAKTAAEPTRRAEIDVDKGWSREIEHVSHAALEWMVGPLATFADRQSQRSEDLARAHPAHASHIRGAERERKFVSFAPYILGIVTGLATPTVTAAGGAEAVAAREATGFLGSRGAPLANASYQPLRNADVVIGGRTFGGHALDQMQNRGLMPSVVENAIQNGVRSADPIVGRFRFFDAVNKVTVIAEGEEARRIITVIPGSR